MDNKALVAMVEELQARAVASEIAMRLLIELAPEQTRKELLALANHLADAPPIAMPDASLARTAKTLQMFCDPINRDGASPRP